MYLFSCLYLNSLLYSLRHFSYVQVLLSSNIKSPILVLARQIYYGIIRPLLCTIR